MTGQGSPSIRVDGTGLRVAIVAARWHEQITDALLTSAVRACQQAGVADPTVVRVPGAFELPVVAKAAAAGHDAVVCLGVVIRGGTPHFEYVCHAATSGLTQVAVETGVPIGFGVLTCDSEEQALDRAGVEGSSEDKGKEAAEAALATAAALRSLR